MLRMTNSKHGASIGDKKSLRETLGPPQPSRAFPIIIGLIYVGLDDEPK